MKLTNFEMMHASRHLAAIVFTDIMGYTAMMGNDESYALQILQKNREIHSKFVSQFEGELIKEMGDGNLLSFPSAIQAVKCSIAIQKESRNTKLENKIRIGIHLGDVVTDNKDVFGEGVNIASRLQAKAEPGGIYLSEDIQRVLLSHPDIVLSDVGNLTLKNVVLPVRVYAVTGDGFPKPRSRFRNLLKPQAIFLTVLILFGLVIGAYQLNDLFSHNHKIRSVAVLPFDNMSGNPDDDYFAAGMTQLLSSNLKKVSAIRIMGSISSDKVKSAGLTDAEIVKQLSVDAVIRGSVLKEGSVVRITAQMFDARSNELIWSESYDKDVVSILQLHSEVAQDIVRQVSVIVNPKERQALQEAPKVNAEAYDDLLKGLYHLYKIESEHYEIALQYFNRVLAIDPKNAKALAGIGMVWIHMGQWGGADPILSGEECKKVTERALQLDNKQAMAHLAMAQYYSAYAWQWKSALHEFKEAIALDPSSPEPRVFYADLLLSLHQNEEALEQIDIAHTLDPLNAFTHCLRGWVYLVTNDYDKALYELNKAIELEPDLALAHRCLWTVHHIRGNYDLAIKHAAKFYGSQEYPDVALNLISGYEKMDYKHTLEYAAHELVNTNKGKNIQGMRVARLYSLAGQKDLALNWLEEAYRQHYPSFFSLNVDPHWESLHAEPRFINLVTRMNLTLN